jgi:hypothetical protein
VASLKDLLEELERAVDEYNAAPTSMIIDTINNAKGGGTMKITATAEFFVNEATGPNPRGKRFELLDDDGIRLSYVDTLEEAQQDIAQLIEFPVHLDMQWPKL